MTEKADQEVIVLKDLAGRPEAIVCAVPYLRDRDIRLAEPGESLDDKNQRLLQGIEAHYTEILKLALKKQEEIFLKTLLSKFQLIIFQLLNQQKLLLKE